MIGVFIFITKYSLGLKIQKTEVMNIVQSYCRKFVEFWTTEGYERGRGGKRIMKQKGKERNRRKRTRKERGSKKIKKKHNQPKANTMNIFILFQACILFYFVNYYGHIIYILMLSLNVVKSVL